MYSPTHTWATIRSWPQPYLRLVDQHLFEDGYELARESAADPTYAPMKRRVARMWRLSQATNAEIERRYAEEPAK